MKQKVVLADDHQLLREGLKSLLMENESVEVIGEANTGREVIQLAAELKPDIIVMDISMPDINGIEATKEIKQINPKIKILALSMHSDKESVKRMLRAGAVGYVVKSTAFEEMDGAIETVMAGKIFISTEVAGIVFEDYTELLHDAPDPDESPLTEREREILKLLAEGKNSKEIADICFISASTVDTHRKKIMTKLKINSVAELTKYAIKEGLTHLD